LEPPRDRYHGAPRASVGYALRQGAECLRRLQHAEPRREAELLLVAATGRSREQLIAWPEHPLTVETWTRYRDLLERRSAGEPIAYILGHKAFWTLELRVDPATLIPRPETELLVEIALELLPPDRRLSVADPGTGSGAIAAALAAERPGWHLIAIEREPQAVGVAAANLRHLVPGNTCLLRGNWLATIRPTTLDAVVSNPPYIRAGDPHLHQGDLRFEPPGALAAGADGLSAIRCLAAEAAVCLLPGGLLILEHGFDQGADVREMLARLGYRDIETRRDLAGLERATLGYLGRTGGEPRAPGKVESRPDRRFGS
jgi:release factor glutamine methyltransferase